MLCLCHVYHNPRLISVALWPHKLETLKLYMVATYLKFQVFGAFCGKQMLLFVTVTTTEVFAKLLDSMSLDIWTINIENFQSIIEWPG